jgi:hypothetical protein
MAAKKKATGQSAVDAAAKAIENRYGNKYEKEGSRTLAAYTRSLQDVVAESPLYERFSSKTLDAAAAKVARKQWIGYMAGNEDQRKARKKK